MEQADLAIIEEKPRRKRRSRGFGTEAEDQSLDSQAQIEEFAPEAEEQTEEDQHDELVEAPVVPASTVSSAPKRHVPLVRPMTPKKAVPQRGTKGASRVRP